jgi:hypothetical protein
MSRDILNEIASGKLSEEQADEAIAEILDAGDDETVDLAELLGLTTAEWTASAQGAWWEELANWRRNGWPTTCLVCGETVVVDNFGWLVVHINDKGELKHIKCPPKI